MIKILRENIVNIVKFYSGVDPIKYGNKFAYDSSCEIHDGIDLSKGISEYPF